MDDGTLIVLLIHWFFSTVIAIALGNDKGRGAEGFLLGFFLGVFGVLTIALLPPTLKKQAENEAALQQLRTQLQSSTSRQQVSTPQQTSAAGWHPDPLQRHQLRYWDGSQWTQNVSNNGVQSLD